LPNLRLQRINPEEYNYSYMPVVFDNEETLLRAERRLEGDRIYPRRYFYPSLNTVPIFRPQPQLPVSERVARTVLCLPLYDTLSTDEIERICRHVVSVL
jgi:hypothetical protein